MTPPRHIVLAIHAGIYRVEVVRGVARASGGVFREPVSLDHLAELLIALDSAADELRDRAENGNGGGR